MRPKRSAVNRAAPSEAIPSLLSFFNEYRSFVVISHEGPDGDCVGASLALADFLHHYSQNTLSVALYSPGPFARFEIQQFQHHFRVSVDSVWENADAVIVLDCSTPERIGFFQDRLGNKPVAVIDHHSAGEQFGTVRCIDPSAPSVTFLIYRLFDYVNLTPTGPTARNILFGLCTDTGFFRHITENSEHVFQVIGRLTAAGASPNEMYNIINGNRPIESRRLLGTLLERTESFFEGRLLVTYEKHSDLRKFDTSLRDSDTLYSLLQTVHASQVVALLRDEKNGALSVGLRSNNHIDVGAIARELGGGGHKKASGFTWTGTAEEAKTAIKERCKPYFCAL